MWRNPFLNLSFIVLVITLLAVQRSVTQFGPDRHTGWEVGDGWPGRDFISAGKVAGSLPAPPSVRRAAGLLDDIWHRGVIFNEWLMEYNTSRWDIFHASTPAEGDLIEARFRVANAEVFTEGLNKNDRAIQEFARAAKFLEEAQPLVKGSAARQLTAIRGEITAAELKEQTEKNFSTVPFETIKANLDHLIEIVRVSQT
jgi:hypothetical protein